MQKDLKILSINQFDDYNCCLHCDNSFYIRQFNDHLKDNTFLDKPHGHNFYIILLITEGTGSHCIDLASYPVQKGSMFVISPGQIHNWALSAETNGFIIFFTKEFASSDSFKINSFLNQGNFRPFFQLGQQDLDKVLDLMDLIVVNYTSPNRNREEILKLYLKILLYELESKSTNLEIKHKITYHQDLLIRFEKLVEDHFTNHLSVAIYAEKLNISIKQLLTCTKKLLNKTPGEIIQDRLIMEAKRLLIHTDMPVYRISDFLNYSDSSYFIRLFRKATGATPELYRSQLEVNLINI